MAKIFFAYLFCLFVIRSFVANATDGEKQAGFSCTFQSYSCPLELSTRVKKAINQTISEGGLPILVSDIDETILIKSVLTEDTENSATIISTSSTKLYDILFRSTEIFKLHGILALTARPVGSDNVAHLTRNDLRKAAPVFFDLMTDPLNLDGAAVLKTVKDPQGRFLCERSLIIMGNGGLSKYDTLNEYFKNDILKDGHKYGIIFIDDNIDWFPAFATGSYDPRIFRCDLFHYSCFSDGINLSQLPSSLALSNTTKRAITTADHQQSMSCCTIC